MHERWFSEGLLEFKDYNGTEHRNKKTNIDMGTGTTRIGVAMKS